MTSGFAKRTVALLMAFAFVLMASGCGDKTPDDAVRTYVRNLNKGRCRQAYKSVYFTTREYDPRYSTYELFKQNVCDPVKRKYVKTRVFRIDEVLGGGDESIVYFRLEFHPKAQAYKGKRAMNFEMRRIGRRWYIKGPALEI